LRCSLIALRGEGKARVRLRLTGRMISADIP
jgi:hypothetical protein